MVSCTKAQPRARGETSVAHPSWSYLAAHVVAWNTFVPARPSHLPDEREGRAEVADRGGQRGDPAQMVPAGPDARVVGPIGVGDGAALVHTVEALVHRDVPEAGDRHDAEDVERSGGEKPERHLTPPDKHPDGGEQDRAKGEMPFLS